LLATPSTSKPAWASSVAADCAASSAYGPALRRCGREVRGDPRLAAARSAARTTSRTPARAADSSPAVRVATPRPSITSPASTIRVVRDSASREETGTDPALDPGLDARADAAIGRTPACVALESPLSRPGHRPRRTKRRSRRRQERQPPSSSARRDRP
jgi:hypothetical protein